MGKEVLDESEGWLIERDRPYRSVHEGFARAFPHNHIPPFEYMQGRMFESWIPLQLQLNTKKFWGGVAQVYPDDHIIVDSSLSPLVSLFLATSAYYLINNNGLELNTIAFCTFAGFFSTLFFAMQRKTRFHEYAHLIHQLNQSPDYPYQIPSYSSFIEEKLTEVATVLAMKSSPREIDRQIAKSGSLITFWYGSSFLANGGRKYIAREDESYYAATYLNGFRFGTAEGQLVTYPPLSVNENLF